MKTITFSLLFLSIFLTIACSNDDKDSNMDSLVGTWQPLLEVDACTGQSDDVSVYSECEKMGSFTFFENGTFKSKTYNDSSSSGTCGLDLTDNSNWLITDGKLYLKDSNTSALEEVTYFNLSGDTLKVGYYDDEFCSGGYYYTEFKRVN